VLEHRGDVGIALDGDGDRLVMVDGNGHIYDGDQLLYVIAVDRQARGELVGGVVGTLMSNLGFEQALSRRGIAFARAAVGDRYVLEMLIERDWVLGGENSGHILCLDKHTTGDAIIAALQVLTVMRRTGRTLAELTADCPLYPQRMINVRTTQRIDWRARPDIVRAKDLVETALAGNGRVLLRPSGTEPVLRVMVEAQDAALAERQARQLAAAVAQSAHGDAAGDFK
jgi:phosphoglucosamine mutase